MRRRRRVSPSAWTGSSTATGTTSGRGQSASEVARMSIRERNTKGGSAASEVARPRAAAGAGASPSAGLHGEADAAEAAGARGDHGALPRPGRAARCRRANAKVHTSACQFCNVGCGYKIYTWPVSATPESAGPRGPLPEAAARGLDLAGHGHPHASWTGRTATSSSCRTRTASSTRATTPRGAAPTPSRSTRTASTR